jgi:hypothetical protein
MTGIVKILPHVADTFVQRCYVAFVAHHFAFTFLNFESARLAVWRGALKIRVSMVRFRPRPPFETVVLLCSTAVFLLRLAFAQYFITACSFVDCKKLRNPKNFRQYNFRFTAPDHLKGL